MDDLVKRLHRHADTYPGLHRPLGLADMCREAADLIEAQAAEISAHREKIAAWMLANSLPTGHGDTVDDLLAEASAGIAALRAGDWVGPLLRWTDYGALYLVGMRVAVLRRPSDRLEATVGETWRTILFNETDDEAEARAAVEAVVKEALGVKPATEPVDKDAHMDCYQYGTVSVIAEPVRTCATCAYKDVEAHADPCFGCWTWSYWTPKPIPSTIDKGEGL